MQYVNHDMDELFRKAAEDYPLDTSGKDWTKVVTMLQDDTVPKETNGKKKYGRFAWLLLLVPLYLICNRPVSSDNDITASKTPVLETETGLSKGSGTHSNEMKSSTKALIEPIPVPNTVSENNESNLKESNVIAGQSAKSQVATSGKWKNNNASNSSSSQINHYTSTTEEADDAVIDVLRVESDALQENLQDQTSNRAAAVTFIEREGRETLAENKSFDREDIVKQTTPVGRLSKAKKLYLGLMAGADITSIKMQKSDGWGHEYGVVLGYAFNKKWSVEAGAFLQKKPYYSDGKYLNSPKIYRPLNAEITEVNAICDMVDLSIAAKYNWRKTARSEFFSTAGLSSYFMKKEDYSFIYYYPQTGMSYHYNHVYRNESRNYLSVMNISVGYSRQLGKVGTIRLEPYVKLPLKELGFGGLPLLSTGVRLGLTKDLL